MPSFKGVNDSPSNGSSSNLSISSGDSSYNSEKSPRLPCKGPPKKGNYPNDNYVPTGKDPFDDNNDSDDSSYECPHLKDYESYNFTESYRKKVDSHIVKLRQSGRSGEGYRALKHLPTFAEHHLIKEAPYHFKICKKENISFLLKQTIKLFNDRVTYGDIDNLEESELYYKNLLLEHGAYLLLHIDKGHVCAAGVLDNGYKYGSTPWSKLDVLAVRKYGNGHGSLLMKHMVDAADGHTIFVYDITDRNENTL